MIQFLRRRFLYLAGAALATPALSSTPGLTLLIIRHAEKPGGSLPGPGLDAEGVKDSKSLLIRGWERAGGWAALFGAGLGGVDFPKPAAIYAADPDSTTGDEPSQRPYETITPLAARLGLTPITTYAVGQERDLVSELVMLSGVALVCWEHKAIEKALLPAIAGDEAIEGLPRKWDSDRFDIVLRFDRSGPAAPWSFRQLFPRLLAGDSSTPMI